MGGDSCNQKYSTLTFSIFALVTPFVLITNHSFCPDHKRLTPFVLITSDWFLLSCS